MQQPTKQYLDGLEEVYWDIIGNPNRSIVPATRNHVKQGLCKKKKPTTDIDKETL